MKSFLWYIYVRLTKWPSIRFVCNIVNFYDWLLPVYLFVFIHSKSDVMFRYLVKWDIELAEKYKYIRIWCLLLYGVRFCVIQYVENQFGNFMTLSRINGNQLSLEIKNVWDKIQVIENVVDWCSWLVKKISDCEELWSKS